MNRNKNFSKNKGSGHQASFKMGIDTPIKKQKNIPAEIWAKRNILKKLTVQMKFNKNQTTQFKKLRTQIQESIYHKKNTHQKNKIQNKQISNQSSSPTYHKKKSKIFNPKGQNIVKLTNNFFASLPLSLQTLKSYHHKSVDFQGNNFINVSKAVIFQKNSKQKNSNPYSHRRLSFSHREKQKQCLSPKRHQRTSSNIQNQISLVHEDEKNKTDFLKISSKKVYLNDAEFSNQEIDKEISNVFCRRSKTELNGHLHLTSVKRKKSQNQMKITNSRPKSCIVQSKKSFQITNCQGWNIKKSARQQQQPFVNFLRF